MAWIGRPSIGKKKTTQISLRAAVFEAAQVLEARYDDPPTVRELAAIVGVSVSHFHEVFQGVVGETVAQHGIRLRVEKAASLLRYSDLAVGEIGFSCGFQTAASFSRAFRRLYGMTPQQFRNSQSTQPYRRSSLQKEGLMRASGGNCRVPTVRVESWPELQMIGLRAYGKVTQMYKPWGELLSWARGNLAELTQARFFGLWFDDWSSLAPELYRYECAIVPRTPLEEAPPEPFFVRTLPAGEVAVSYAQGGTSAVDLAWRDFVLNWLPHSGYLPRGHFALDQYPADFVLKSGFSQLLQAAIGKLELDLCIPITRP